MPEDIWGRFARRKWCTPLRISLPTSSGNEFRSFEWSDAILDTGSPVHVLPGIAPACIDRSTAKPVERVYVKVRPGGESGLETVEFRYGDYFPIPIGGIETRPLFRLEFWATFYALHIPMLNDAPFVFMDVPHPIISVGQCLEQGGRFVFEYSRFSAR